MATSPATPACRLTISMSSRARNAISTNARKSKRLLRMHPSLRVRYVTPRGAHPLDKESARLFVRTAVPVRGASHIGWFETIQDAIAQDGHCLVLNGDNGNIGISWAGAFSLATLAREGRYATLLKEARAIAHVEKRALGRVLLSELVMRMAPRPCSGSSQDCAAMTPTMSAGQAFSIRTLSSRSICIGVGRKMASTPGTGYLAVRHAGARISSSINYK